MTGPAARTVSWEEFHRDCRSLAAQLAVLGPFTALIAVTRGGLVPAGILAHELAIGVIETISLASYHVGREQGELKLLKDVSPRFRENGAAGLLVVDDLVDTGNTARFLRTHLPRAHLAAVYAKPQGLLQLDTYVAAVPQEVWIDLPWELTPVAPRS